MAETLFWADSVRQGTITAIAQYVKSTCSTRSNVIVSLAWLHTVFDFRRRKTTVQQGVHKWPNIELSRELTIPSLVTDSNQRT